MVSRVREENEQVGHKICSFSLELSRAKLNLKEMLIASSANECTYTQVGSNLGNEDFGLKVSVA